MEEGLSRKKMKMPQANYVISWTEPLRRGPRGQGCNTDKCVFVKQVIFLTVNHRGPLPLRELHSIDETRLWWDPGGAWACLQPVYDYGWNHPATGCDTCRLRQGKHSEKKGAIWNVKRTKNSKGRAGQTKGENETENEASRTDEGDILSTTLNSTNKKRTWVGEGPPPAPPPPPQKKKPGKKTMRRERSPTV